MVKNKLRDLRIKRDLSQVALAEAIGVSRQTIHAIEVEKYTPSVELALKIAKYFKISVEKIFYLEKESEL